MEGVGEEEAEAVEVEVEVEEVVSCAVGPVAVG